MKNFVKHTLAIAICAVALLSSCIKEQPYELKIAQLEVAVTRADDASSTSQEQGDGIGNAMFWVFKCSGLKDNGAPTEVSTDAAVSWRVMHTVNTSTSMTAHMELPLCDTEYQDYILVAILNTDAFGDTIQLDQNTKFADLQQALFDASDAEFWDEYPVDEEGNRTPWKMPISNWKTFTVSKSNTHPSYCYKLNLPVYRAVAKAQLFVKPKTDNFTVTVTDAKIHSAGMPTKGAILTANTKDVLDNNYGVAVKSQQGNADESVKYPAVYPPAFPYGTSDGTRQLYNTIRDSANVFDRVEADTTTYTWAGSTFIYENAQVLSNTADYKQDPTDITENTGNNGYYMEISYKVSGDTQTTYTRYVALPAVVRNHDYQVKATVDAGGEMTLNIEVVDWKQENISMKYENTVTIDPNGFLKWTQLPNTTISSETGITYQDQVINMTESAGQVAVCTFALQTPQYGTWHAELLTIEGVSGAIAFFDQDGNNLGTSTSGPISWLEGDEIPEGKVVGDPRPGKLIIKTVKGNYTGEGSLGRNLVELRIYATGPAGVYQIPNLPGVFNTDGTTIKFSYYQLLQPRM